MESAKRASGNNCVWNLNFFTFLKKRGEKQEGKEVKKKLAWKGMLQTKISPSKTTRKVQFIIMHEKKVKRVFHSFFFVFITLGCAFKHTHTHTHTHALRE